MAYFCIIGLMDMSRRKGICFQRGTERNKGQLDDQKKIRKQNQEIYLETKSNPFAVAPGDQPLEMLVHKFLNAASQAIR